MSITTGESATEAEHVRGRIASAASALVRREGLAALTPAALGRDLHLRPATIARFVDSFEEVLDGVTAEAQSELIDLAASSIGETRGAEALQALLEAYRVYALAQPHMYEAAMRRPARRDGAAAIIAEALTDLELRTLEGCGASPDRARQLAWCARAAIYGAIRLELRDRGSAPSEIDLNVERLIALLQAAARGEIAIP